MLWVRVKKARNTSFSAPPKGPRFSRTRALNASDTRVTGDKSVKKHEKKEGRNLARFLLPAQPRSQSSVLPVPWSEKGTGRRQPWERGCVPLPLRANFHLFLSPEPPVPWAGEAWVSLSTRAWGPPRPRAQTSPAKRTEGSGDENDFHQESDDLVQGSFFLLQGVAVHDLIMETSRSWNDGEGNENVKKASGLKGLCQATYYRFNLLKLVFASIKCQK